MANRLRGKVALISGAARGQGAEHAAVLAGEGARVVLADILDDQGQRTVDQLRRDRLDALYVHLDVTTAAGWRSAVACAEDTYGHLDVLINNAGITATAGLEDLTDQEWERVLAVNQTGVALGMQAAVPALRRSGGGSIINVASNLSFAAIAGYLAYQASKAAVIAMSRAVALECAPMNIRVNSICPGLILSGMTEDEDQAVVEATVRETPLGRIGRPSDVTGAAVYLASDESSWVTGTEIVIDGGLAAR